MSTAAAPAVSPLLPGLVSPRAKFPTFRSRFSPLAPYLIVISLITAADALMSYAAPVFINQHVSTEATMGLIIAFSSVVGLACDFLFARFFRHKPFLFFLGLTLLSAFLFPLSLSYLPPIIPVFLLATGIWGIYYEALAYSNFSFVARYLPIAQHEKAWGSLSMFKAISWTIAPLVASALLFLGETYIFGLVILILLLATLATTIFKPSWRSVHINTLTNQVAKQHSLGTQLKIWKLLLTKIWPLFIFYTMLYIIDATFWTIGVIMAESLKETSLWGGLLITAYMLPTVLFSLLAAPAARPFGKKRMAFLLGIASGLVLSLMAFVSTPVAVVAIVFIFSSLQAIIWPEMFATFENYVARLHEHGMDMVGLQASASSLSYIIGPILAGTLAVFVGNQNTFAILGAVFACISIIMLVIVPRKIKMPQKQLVEIG